MQHGASREAISLRQALLNRKLFASRHRIRHREKGGYPAPTLRASTTFGNATNRSSNADNCSKSRTRNV
jgi:hypothetical protein